MITRCNPSAVADAFHGTKRNPFLAGEHMEALRQRAKLERRGKKFMGLGVNWGMKKCRVRFFGGSFAWILR